VYTVAESSKRARSENAFVTRVFEQPPLERLAGPGNVLAKEAPEGYSSKEMAAVLGVSVKTVDAHCANIMRKLRLRSLSDLVRYAIRNKIVQP